MSHITLEDVVAEKKYSSPANRESVRAPVVPTQIKGLLTRSDSSTQLPFLIWDVSQSGIGLWSAGELKAGEAIKVTVGQPYLLVLECEVRWCESNNDGEGYRVGLAVSDNDTKLQSLYQTFCEQMEEEITRIDNKSS